MTEVTLIELRRTREGTYLERWHCTPPDPIVRYVVTSEQWDKDYVVRDIYEWKPAEAVVPDIPHGT